MCEIYASLIQQGCKTDVNYYLPRCFYDGMVGYLQGGVSVGENVRALRGMTYPISSAKFCIMLKTRLLV